MPGICRSSSQLWSWCLYGVLCTRLSCPQIEVLLFWIFFFHIKKKFFFSWYKEVDPNNPTALIPLTEKSFKYKFEATIPEPDVCTDCILARITVINVISGDYGTYVLRATSEQSTMHMSEGRVRLYRMIFMLVIKLFYLYTNHFLFQKLRNANNQSLILIIKVVVVRLNWIKKKFLILW